jgi:uncharacterized protein (DUF2141 family)
LLALCVPFVVPSGAAADEAAKTGDLEIAVTNLESDKGFLVVVLLNSAEQFSSGDQMFRSNDKVAIRDGKASLTFKNIPFGSYAVKTFHDENSNGKLDTNFVGYPKESFGFSNDAMGKFGPPSFEEAEFSLAARTLRIEIKSK